MYIRSELTKFQVISIDSSIQSVQLMNLSTYDYTEKNLSDFKYEIQEGQDVFGFYWNDNLYIDQISPKKLSEHNAVLENDDKAFV